MRTCVCVQNKNKAECWLGVCAHGLGVYEKTNRLEPSLSFKWSEIRNISFKDKKFKVKTSEKSDASETATLNFSTHDIAISQVVSTALNR